MANVNFSISDNTWISLHEWAIAYSEQDNLLDLSLCVNYENINYIPCVVIPFEIERKHIPTKFLRSGYLEGHGKDYEIFKRWVLRYIHKIGFLDRINPKIYQLANFKDREDLISICIEIMSDSGLSFSTNFLNMIEVLCSDEFNYIHAPKDITKYIYCPNFRAIFAAKEEAEGITIFSKFLTNE